MAGSTTGALMSHGMAGIKPQRRLNYTTSYYSEPPKYYTASAKAPYYYTTTHAALSY
jgi:hypothetical protein